MTLQTTPASRQQIPNTHQWTNWEVVLYAVRTTVALRNKRRIVGNGVIYAVRAEVL
jgi:hypothetical protein